MVSERLLFLHLLLPDIKTKSECASSSLLPFELRALSVFIFFQVFSDSGFLQHWRHAMSISWDTFLWRGLADNCLPWIDCKYRTVQILTVGLITLMSLTLWTRAAWTRKTRGDVRLSWIFVQLMRDKYSPNCLLSALLTVRDLSLRKFVV